MARGGRNLAVIGSGPVTTTGLTELRRRLGLLLLHDGFDAVTASAVMTVEDAYDRMGVPADAAIRSTTNTVYLDDSTVLAPHLTPFLLQHTRRSGLRRCWVWGDVYRARRASARRTHCEILSPAEDLPAMVTRLAHLAGAVLGVDVSLTAQPARFPGLVAGVKLHAELGGGWHGAFGAAGVLDPDVIRRFTGQAPDVPVGLAGLPLRVLPGLLGAGAAPECREVRSPSAR
jgi:phenylalanyl-tRNA synthetase alpha subunit